MKAKKKAPLSPVVTKSHGTRRADKDKRREEKALIRRHQAALRAIDKLDAMRIAHPHIPTLANDVLRNDDLKDIPPIIQTIIERAGECPDKPLPDIPEYSLFAPPAWEVRDVLMTGASLLGIFGCILIAVWLASGAK